MSPLCVEDLNEQVVLHLTISLGGYLLNLLGRTRTTTQDLLLSLLVSQGVGLLPDISFFLHMVCRSELKSLLFMWCCSLEGFSCMLPVSWGLFLSFAFYCIFLSVTLGCSDIMESCPSECLLGDFGAVDSWIKGGPLYILLHISPKRIFLGASCLRIPYLDPLNPTNV